MISFAHPEFLWGLTALSLPIAIHLLSRKEGKVIYLGSLRHLVESNTRQSISIRLNEILLLILRLIALTLLVCYVSGLQWTSSSGAQKKWLLIEKGLERNKKLQPVFDSLQLTGYETHFLSSNFSALSDSNNVKPIVSYWELIELLQSQGLTSAVVFSYNRQELFKGTRLSLPSEIQWIACDNLPSKFPVQSTIFKDNIAIVRAGYSGESGTYFETSTVTDASDQYFKFPNGTDSVASFPADTLRILLSSRDAFSRDVNVLRAALASLQDALPQWHLVIDSKPILSKYDWIFQIGSDSQNISTDNRVILKENPSVSLLVQSGAGQWQLTHRLTEGIALKANLSLQLAQMLFPALESWKRAALQDRRPMDGKMLWSAAASKNKGPVQAAAFTKNVDSLLMTLIVFVILFERIISHHRNQ